MKKLSTFIFCLLSLGTLVGQVRLDVEGDAKIRGRLDIKQADDDGSLFIGENAGMSDDPAPQTSNFNTFVGSNAGKANTEGSFNAFFGLGAGKANTEGSFNSFFGYLAGANNTDGSFNSFFGLQTGLKNIGGKHNAFFGVSAGGENINGNENAFFGYLAGNNNTNGNSNAFFGFSTGTLKNNTKSTLLGCDAETINDLDRAIAIGYQARVDCHNCAVIGGIGDNAVKVGIGTSTPLTDLYIKQSSRSAEGGGGLTFENSSTALKWKIYHSGLYLSFAENTGSSNGDAVRRSYIESDNGAYIQESSNLRSRNSSNVKEDVLNRLVALSVKHYPSLNSRNKTQKSLGFNTLEVQKLFPEVVREAEDGSLGMAYADFGILAIKAIQELVLTVEEQEQENILQKEQIVTLAERLDDTDALRETVNTQQSQINELKSLVETLLTQNAITPKSTSYVLPLEQQALLAQNQPNPFRENTLVDYFVPAEVQHAHIQVTGLDGQVLGQVSISKKGKGQVTIQSKSYPAGTYFYSLVLDGQVIETKRMVLAR